MIEQMLEFDQYKETVIRTFVSMDEFYRYITETPFNKHFAWANPKDIHSLAGSYFFTKTSNFDQASKMFKDGWQDKAATLTQKLKTAMAAATPVQRPRPAYNVQGYQASVPRYLQGLPDSMITKKNVPVKQKVVELTKAISYTADVTPEQIEEQSIKCLMIVERLESLGYRVILNVIRANWDFSGPKGHKVRHLEVAKVRIKSAAERLNISKVAFPLVHPSMLRRLMFRYTEVSPTVPKSFVDGYGCPLAASKIRALLKETSNGKEIFIPAFINGDVSQINSIDDLQSINDW